MKFIGENEIYDYCENIDNIIFEWLLKPDKIEIHIFEVYTLIEKGDAEIIKYLVEKDADKICHAYPIGCAAREGQLEIMKYLMKNMTDINFADEIALVEAAENEHVEIINYLVERSANVFMLYEFTENTWDKYECIYATHNEHMEITKYLYAAQNGQVEIMKYLVLKIGPRVIVWDKYATMLGRVAKGRVAP